MPNILIVDDDPLYIQVYKLKFLAADYKVETANNGEDALAKLASFPADIVLLDVMMPKMDGFEVLKKLKSDPKHKNLPVVLLTNLGGDDDNTQHGLKLGAHSYLIKASHTPKEIVDYVANILTATHSKK